MPVSFSQIPINWKQPLFWAEIDPSMAGINEQQLPALVVGQMITSGGGAGTATPDVPIAVFSAAEAISLFGAGSMLAQMFAAFFANNSAQQVWGLPVADPSAGAVATGTITFSAAPTQAGTFNLYVAGQYCPVGCNAGDTVTIVATNTAAAINATTSLPVTATSALGVVTLTCKHKGLLGNDITMLNDYYGTIGGQTLPPGLVVAYSGSGQLTGGSGTPTFTALEGSPGDSVANISPYQYEFVAMPFNDSNSWVAWDAEFGMTSTGRWGFMREQFGEIFSAYRGGYSASLTAWGTGSGKNSAVISIMSWEPQVPTTMWECCAAYCAVAALALTADPGRPLQSLEMQGILTAPLIYRWTTAERNALAFNGMATQAASPSNVPMIMRETLNYQANNYGQSDQAFELVTTLSTLATLIRNMKGSITSKYPRSKLANDDTNFSPGQAIVTPKIIRAEIIAQYTLDEYNGLCEDLVDFKNNLIVERSLTDPNRVDVLYPPAIINQLRVFATLVQFRLMYNPTNGGAPITNSLALSA